MTTVIDDTNIKKLLDKAKIALMSSRDSAFYTTILFSLKFVWDDSQSTAWVDGIRLGFNRAFFMKCTPEQRVFVLVHEACHVAQLHILRGKGLDDIGLYYKAADHNINLMLKARGFKMFDWVLADPRFVDMSTDQIYKILLQEKKDGQPQEPNNWDDIREPGDDPDRTGNVIKQTPADIKRQIDDILIRAVAHSKLAGDKAGTVPGEVEMYLKNLLNPKLPWQVILRKYLKELGKFDYSWKRPNRRFFPDHYMPSMWSEGGLSDFQAWVDISCSESDDDFLRYISELNGVMRMMKPKKLTLGQFDTRITHVDEVRTIMDLAKVKFHGRGGTNITEVLDRIEKTKPKVALIFTDGGFYMDRQKLNGKANIIWMIHDNPEWTAPFGKVIHFTTYDK